MPRVRGVHADLVGSPGARAHAQERRRPGARDGLELCLGGDRVSPVHGAQPRIAGAADGRRPDARLPDIT